jgi:hypothetical protein
VSNLDTPAGSLYDDLYCQRGEAENRIKETRLDPFGTRAGSRKFCANGLRCLCSALAYTPITHLSRLASCLPPSTRRITTGGEISGLAQISFRSERAKHHMFSAARAQQSGNHHGRYLFHPALASLGFFRMV